MKHIIVTGGSGFIGTALISELLRNDIKVTMLGRFKNDKYNQHKYNQRIRRINWTLGNIFPDCCSFLDSNWPLADGIIHLAHEWKDQSGACSLNYSATRILFDSARKAGIRRGQGKV